MKRENLVKNIITIFCFIIGMLMLIMGFSSNMIGIGVLGILFVLCTTVSFFIEKRINKEEVQSIKPIKLTRMKLIDKYKQDELFVYLFENLDSNMSIKYYCYKRKQEDCFDMGAIYNVNIAMLGEMQTMVELKDNILAISLNTLKPINFAKE